MFTKHQASLSIGRVKHYSFLYNRVCFLDFIAAIGKFYPYNFEWRMTGFAVQQTAELGGTTSYCYFHLALSIFGIITVI